MERKAHYALIGTFVLVSLAALLAFTAWLSNAQFDKKFDNYEIDKRIEIVKMNDYLEEHYELFRYELANYLNLAISTKNKIIWRATHQIRSLKFQIN